MKNSARCFFKALLIGTNLEGMTKLMMMMMMEPLLAVSLQHRLASKVSVGSPSGMVKQEILIINSENALIHL